MADTRKYRSWVEIDLDCFRHNWNEIRRLITPGVKVMQVVKADAYGHGAIEISRAALKNGVFCLGVANADEGIQLRISGIDAPVIILSPATISEVEEIIKYNLIPSVSDLHFACELNRRAAEEGTIVPVHIEVDTGMGRGGTLHHEALCMIETIAGLRNLKVAGVFSHLSLSEWGDDDYNRHQWHLFNLILDSLKKKNIEIPLKHFANSGGILNFPDFNFDLVRPGIMTYGIHPSPLTEKKADLAPVMSFKTTVVLLKEFPAGCSIGYGRSYRTEKPTMIATIPVGYGDGFGFILSNKGEALVKGKRVPVVGRVSMDMCTLDVTDIPECAVGDEVVLMGRQGSEYLSADEIAGKAGTISYEVLCVVGKRAPRVFVNKGEPDAVEPMLRRVFFPHEERSIARIDNIIRSCFQARASSAEVGDAIYYEMFETLFGRENRRLELRKGFKYCIKVRNFSECERRVDEWIGDYFRVSTHVEYTKILRNGVFLIGCALNNEQLSALFEEERCEYRWLLPGRSELFREQDFMVESVRIDNRKVSIISRDTTKRGYEIWCGGEDLKDKIGQEVKVEIEIVTKKYMVSNTFAVYLVYPTRGLEIRFDYAGVPLKNVREASFFAGKHTYPEVISRPGESITLKLNDENWVFPNSGVAFSWEL
ncbi:MAG: alanine racemase [Syntrophales bacterium]|nr:alanine racemase [Syntrophales bacterium]MDY0044083.1 alanine racemase [Syntrophales bacterium]